MVACDSKEPAQHFRRAGPPRVVVRSDPATLEQLRCCWLLRVKAGKHGDKRILISDDFPGDRQWFD
eukprot:jgi/Chrpa1/18142/Chrysochromulina_OHIO_Genome00023146-RA